MEEPKPISVLESIDLFNSVNHFKNESAMADYVEENIENFCKDILNDTYISHDREFKFFSNGKTSSGIKKPGARIDFLINCKNKNYAIELKNPTNVARELCLAIGQMMLYQDLLECRGFNHELILVTSKSDYMMTRIIAKNNLNFRYILFNKDHSAEYGRKTNGI